MNEESTANIMDYFKEMKQNQQRQAMVPNQNFVNAQLSQQQEMRYNIDQLKENAATIQS